MKKIIALFITVVAAFALVLPTAQAAEYAVSNCGDEIYVTFVNNNNTDSTRTYTVVSQSPRNPPGSQDYKVVVKANSTKVVTIPVPPMYTVTVFFRTESFSHTNNVTTDCVN